MTTTEIEKRLSALEAEVASLKAAGGPRTLWWNKIAGVFSKNPRFDDAMRLGREPGGRPRAPSNSRRGPTSKRKGAR